MVILRCVGIPLIVAAMSLFNSAAVGAEKLPDEATAPLWIEEALRAAAFGQVEGMLRWKLEDWKRARDQLRTAMVGVKEDLAASIEVSKYRYPAGYADAIVEQLATSLALFEAVVAHIEKRGAVNGYERGSHSCHSINQALMCMGSSW